MILNRNINKYTLALMAILNLSFSSPPLFGSEANKIEENVSNEVTSLPRIFTTPKEAIEYGKKLNDLCIEEKYDEALLMAFPEPILLIESTEMEGHKIEKKFTISDLEFYNFHYLFSLSSIFIHKGIKEHINLEKSIEHFKGAINYIDSYLSSETFGISFISRYPNVNLRINGNRCVMYKKGSEAYSHWARLVKKIEESDFEMASQKKLFLTSIDCLEKSIACLEQSNAANEEKSLLKIKFDLFNECVSILNYVRSAERTEFLNKAKELNRQFAKSQHGKYYKSQANKALDFINKDQEFLQYCTPKTSAPKASKKVKELRQKKEKDYLSQLNAISKELLKEGNGRYIPLLSMDIIELHHNLQMTTGTDLRNSENIPLLKKIEEKIQNKLIEAQAPASLLDVYKKYEEFLGGTILINDLITLICPSFLFSGDVEGAMERVNILAELESKKHGNLSLLTRCLRAGIKNLNGDHEEWKAFEEEMLSMRKKEQAKKKASKKRKAQQQAQNIKENQQTLIALEEQKNHPKEEVKSKKQKIQAEVETSDNTNTTFEPLSPSLTAQEEKDEKKKRHEEAEKQREEQRNFATIGKMEASVPTSVSVQTTTSSSQPISEEFSSKISHLYQLTGVAKNVDSEIENNTWMFSRENLMTYFEALGCAATNGGKHKKVSLPKAVMLTRNGEIITILNEFGGALTLPRWDGSEGNGQTPLYLRKQILKAREKLVSLQLKVNKITKPQ